MRFRCPVMGEQREQEDRDPREDTNRGDQAPTTIDPTLIERVLRSAHASGV